MNRSMSGSLNSRITGTSIKYQPLQLESDIDVRRKLFRQKQYKKMCFAAAMAVLGFIMIVVGISWYFVDRKGYSAFMLVGFLAFLPGSYGTYEAIGTLNGWSGFDQFTGEDQDEDSWTYTL